MLRFFILLSISNFLSAELAYSQSQNVFWLPIDKENCEGYHKFSKLKAELDLLSSSDEVQRVRLESMNLSPRFPKSCAEATTVNSESAIYSIQVPSFSAQTFLVYCNTEEQGGGWTVMQRRVDESIDFYRDWAEYKIGFGNLAGNFFISLDKLYALTYAAAQELLITLTDFEKITKYAKYEDFAIGDESQSYALNVLGKDSGNAGYSFTRQQWMKFSRKDKQNDLLLPSNFSCALEFHGAWWYSNCHSSNLNGIYLKGVYKHGMYGDGLDWITWHGDYYSLKTVNMMIRPKWN